MNLPLPTIPGLPQEALPQIPLPTTALAGDLFAQLFAGAQDAAEPGLPIERTADVDVTVGVGPDIAEHPAHPAPPVFAFEFTEHPPGHDVARLETELVVPSRFVPFEDVNPDVKQTISQAGLPDRMVPVTNEPLSAMAVVVDREGLQRILTQGLPADLELPDMAIQQAPTSPLVGVGTDVAMKFQMSQMVQGNDSIPMAMVRGIPTELASDSEQVLRPLPEKFILEALPVPKMQANKRFAHQVQSQAVRDEVSSPTPDIRSAIPTPRPATLQPLAFTQFSAPVPKTTSKYVPVSKRMARSNPAPAAIATQQVEAPASLPSILEPRAVEDAPQIRFVLEDWQPDQPVRSLRITLEPRELGDMKISLHHRATGLHAKMVVDQASALPLVRAQITALQAVLSARGVQFASFSLTAATAGGASGLIAPGGLKSVGMSSTKQSDRQDDFVRDESVNHEVSN